MSWQRVGREIPALAAFFWVACIGAQTLNNQSLTGKYFFRHVSLGTDASGNLTDARSMLGSITFDGAGHYSFNAQQVLGAGAATSQTGSNLAYSVDQAGFVSLASPLRSGETLNARFGPEAVIGSTTESSGMTYDLFVAIPAPTASATLSSLAGSYWGATLEFPGASFGNSINTIFNFVSSGAGALSGAGAGPPPPPITVVGHAANLAAGQPTSQSLSGATYTMGTDGTATVTLGAGSSLLSGTKTVYVSKDGNVLVGGSTANGSHDILIAVKGISNASNATWSASFWGAGLRHDNSTQPETGYVGSEINAGTGTGGGPGNLIWSRRLKVLGVGNVDFTGVHSYSINANGSGTEELAQVALGGASTGTVFIGSVVSPSDPGGYEIYFGVQMPAVTGTGVWINPQGVINPTSFSPTGSPISPGDFIRLYGSGWAAATQSATPPYPLTLNGVTVLVNNAPAAIYAVTPTTIDFLVPWGTPVPPAASTATITVKTAAASSNTVTVPVSATGPGVLTIAQNGAGPGIMQHADYTQVTPAHPAAGGEILFVYLTGLGAVNPAVGDGYGSTIGTPSTTPYPTVLIGGKTATVLYSGLTIYPGLYQINVMMPPVPPGAATLPLAISTPNAYHDQVDIPVQP